MENLETSHRSFWKCFEKHDSVSPALLDFITLSLCSKLSNNFVFILFSYFDEMSFFCASADEMSGALDWYSSTNSNGNNWVKTENVLFIPFSFFLSSSYTKLSKHFLNLLLWNQLSFNAQGSKFELQMKFSKLVRD